MSVAFAMEILIGQREEWGHARQDTDYTINKPGEGFLVTPENPGRL